MPEWLIERNIESWRDNLRFYERLHENPGVEALEPLVRLVRELSESNLARSCRAGQSMATLMVSTKERYGLEKGDPFITVQLEPDGRFAMAYRNPSGNIAASEIVPESQARDSFEKMLAFLLADTAARA